MLLSPRQILTDHFLEPPRTIGEHRSFRWGQVIAVIPPLLVAAIIVWRHIRIVNIAPLLTATSILTGFIFTLALRFWERSLDARSDVDIAFDSRRLLLLERMRAHLLWTVLMGVCSTAAFAACPIFVQSKTGTPVALSGVLGFLLSYQLVLVASALLLFNDAAYLLRRTSKS